MPWSFFRCAKFTAKSAQRPGLLYLTTRTIQPVTKFECKHTENRKSEGGPTEAFGLPAKGHGLKVRDEPLKIVSYFQNITTITIGRMEMVWSIPGQVGLVVMRRMKKGSWTGLSNFPRFSGVPDQSDGAWAAAVGATGSGRCERRQHIESWAGGWGSLGGNRSFHARGGGAGLQEVDQSRRGGGSVQAEANRENQCQSE